MTAVKFLNRVYELQEQGKDYSEAVRIANNEMGYCTRDDKEIADNMRDYWMHKADGAE